MQMRNMMRNFLRFFRTNHRSRVRCNTPNDVESSVTIKKIGPGEFVVIKNSKIVEICNTYGLKHLI